MRTAARARFWTSRAIRLSLARASLARAERNARRINPGDPSSLLSFKAACGEYVAGYKLSKLELVGLGFWNQRWQCEHSAA
jgi:hypothetical protein